MQVTKRMFLVVMYCTILGGYTIGGGGSGQVDRGVDSGSFLPVPKHDTLVSPLIVVTVISVSRDFRANLNLQRYEERVVGTGPDYVLRIVSPEAVDRVLGLLSKVKSKIGTDPDRMDLRYRIELTSDGTPIFTLHADRFGEILLQGRRLIPDTGSRDWLRRLWESAGEDWSPAITP